MLKSTLVASSIALVLGLSSVRAQEISCTNEHMAKVNTEAVQVKDNSRRDTAIKELNTAKAMMGQNKMDQCKTHLQRAMEAMARTKGD